MNPDIVRFVFADAFSPSAAVGGFIGATLREGIRWGVARGIFSNESGLGTGGIAAAAAQSHVPASQALVSMTQTFIDTIVVCSVTGFVIIATGAWTKVDPATGHGLTGAPLTATAFSTGLPGNWGGYIVALGLAFFAFSTILGWSYYGKRAVEYLFGVRAITPYRMVFVVAAFVGSFALEFGEAQRAGFAAVWGFSDVMNGAMAIPNLVGLLMLSRIVVGETQRYRAARQSPEGG